MAEWINWLQSEEKGPLYEILYRNIAADIIHGALKTGDRLPSKRVLSEGLSVSHSTVETAYGLLIAEGYIRSVSRVGYVVEPFVPVSGIQTEPPLKKPLTIKENSGLSFSTGSVDTTAFPYASFAKIYRDVIYHGPELLSLGDPRGDLAFRTSLSAMLQDDRGITCDPDDIVVGAGVEILLGLLFDLMPKIRRVGMEDPGYPRVYETAYSRGKKVISIPIDEDGIRMEKLKKADPRLVFVTPSHEFPLGITMSATRRSELLSWAGETNSYIIEDDYDSVFRYASRPIRALKGMDVFDRVIYLGTFSRSVAPSIRCAFMVLPRPIMDRFLSQKVRSSQTVSRFEQQTLTTFLDRGLYSRHLRRLTHLYKERSDQLKALLADIPDNKITGDEAGLHFLLHLPKLNEEKLLLSAKERNLTFHLINEYCHHRTFKDTILVLGFAHLAEEDMKEAVRLLKECIQEARH